MLWFYSLSSSLVLDLHCFQLRSCPSTNAVPSFCRMDCDIYGSIYGGSRVRSCMHATKKFSPARSEMFFDSDRFGPPDTTTSPTSSGTAAIRELDIHHQSRHGLGGRGGGGPAPSDANLTDFAAGASTRLLRPFAQSRIWRWCPNLVC